MGRKKVAVPKGGNRARKLGLVRHVAVEVPAALAEALRRCASEDRRSHKATVQMALEAWLASRGYWPPQN
jgi:hypothetical protein